MKGLRSHFVFNKSERNGIFLLVLIIILLQGVYFYVNHSTEVQRPVEQSEAVKRLQRQIDSLKALAVSRDSFQRYPFNPNFISDFKGYTLGMSVEEIDKLHAFRASDNWVNSAKEFQEVTGVSDSLLKDLSPYFKFPDFKKSTTVKPPLRKIGEGASRGLRPPLVQDLNSATADALMEVRGVGAVLSQRIVKYRESIGGFRDEIQLGDVYGLSPAVVAEILKSFRIASSSMEKQDLNSISVLALAEIPGFTYELARKVVELRNLKNGFASFEELRQIKDFPVEKLDRIQLYLTID